MAQTRIRVLLVEDDEEDYLLTRRLLTDNARASFELKWVRTYEAALVELRAAHEVCLADYRLGTHTGLDLIKSAVAAGFRGPLILLTGRGDHKLDADAMSAGAADYLVKGEISAELMERVIHHAIERKAAEEALRSSEQQLRQSQKMEAIGSLAGGIAHDLNNLLSVILSYSDLLSTDLRPGDPMRADLESINAAGWRAANLTAQLLAFSRQQVLQPRIVDLNAVCAGTEQMLRRVLGADVEFISIAGAALGEITVDPGQMEQVIMNLAVNARDAMPKGGTLTIETANVLLSASDAAKHVGVQPGPHVMLAVTDTGMGMDETTQARIFEPFFTTKEIGKGTGLGLSTVFGIVRQSGGSIWVASELGKGTTFRTYFPRLPASVVVELPPSPVIRPDLRSLRGSETVLIVEDEERVRLLACAILRRYGYEVLHAQSGGDALIICEQHEHAIELLLTDVVMPRMSGLQLAARLLSMRPAMRVLYMTGYAPDTTLAEIRATGATLFQKPITPEALARRVRGVLDASPKN